MHTYLQSLAFVGWLLSVKGKEEESNAHERDQLKFESVVREIEVRT